MTLGEALHRYLKAGIQGQLVVKLTDEEHLCKVSIEDGHAVYISLGKIGPEETMAALPDKEVEWINFIEGMPSRKRLPQSLNKRLTEIAAAINPSVTATTQVKPSAAGMNNELALSHGAPAETVEAIIEDFVDLIGPLGTILAEKAAQDLGYRQGALMETSALESFVDVLAGEIAEEERKTFIDKHRP